MKSKIILIKKDVTGEFPIHPNLSEIFPAYQNRDEMKLYPLLAIDLSKIRHDFSDTIYFFELAPVTDCIWYKIENGRFITDLNTANLFCMEEIPQKLSGYAQIQDFEFETTAIEIQDDDNYIDHDRYDYTNDNELNLEQWSSDFASALRQNNQGSGIIGHLGGFPDFVQGDKFCGGTFIGQIYTYELNGIGLHCYLFYNKDTKEVAQFNQMT